MFEIEYEISRINLKTVFDFNFFIFVQLDRAGTLPKSKPPEGRGRKSLEPPKSLAVREVSKLAKGSSYLHTLSAESIGQCSLDVLGKSSVSHSLSCMIVQNLIGL